MNVLRQGVSNELVLALEVDRERYPRMEVRFVQNGQTLMIKTAEEGAFEEDGFHLLLREDETARFSPQRFAMEIWVKNESGSECRRSDSIPGIVDRSGSI